jgi:hypothetical protein
VGNLMAEAVRNIPQEYWHPPGTQDLSGAGLPVACSGCGAEFMLGSHFCHLCGSSRLVLNSESSPTTAHLEFLRSLEFYRIKSWIGLPTASLVAFLIGIGCVLAALAVGLIYSAQSFPDFQAIQLWRMQWLLAAVAAFLVGILLKSSAQSDRQREPRQSRS